MTCEWRGERGVAIDLPQYKNNAAAGLKFALLIPEAHEFSA